MLTLLTGAAAFPVIIGFVGAFWGQGLERWYTWKLESDSAAEREAAAVWLGEHASPAVLSRLSALVEGENPQAAGIAMGVIWKVLGEGSERERRLAFLIDKARLRKVTAVVKEVDRATKLILLSGGKDQGVAVGDVFVIRRGEELVGDAKVIKVFPDLCGCELREAPGTAGVNKGDRAIGLVTGP